jgi:ATP-dependent helicase/nuclease subunit B
MQQAPWPAARGSGRPGLSASHRGSCKPRPSARVSPRPWLREVKGRWPVDGLPHGRGVTLVGKADRIDRLPDGRIAIYDYKSGKPPTEKEERSFAKQLWLEAAMAAKGAFGTDGPLETARVAYIGLGASPEVSGPDPTPDQIAALAAEFRRFWPITSIPAPALRRVARSRTRAGAATTTTWPATVSGTKPRTSSACLSGTTHHDRVR